jgi:hypothetical protein
MLCQSAWNPKTPAGAPEEMGLKTLVPLMSWQFTGIITVAIEGSKTVGRAGEQA